MLPNKHPFIRLIIEHEYRSLCGYSDNFSVKQILALVTCSTRWLHQEKISNYHDLRSCIYLYGYKSSAYGYCFQPRYQKIHS